MICYTEPKEIGLEDFEIVRLRKELLPSLDAALAPYVFIGKIGLRQFKILEGCLLIEAPELRYTRSGDATSVGLIRTVVLNPIEEETLREGILDEIIGEYVFDLQDDTETGLLVGQADKWQEGITRYAAALIDRALSTTKKDIIDFLDDCD